MKILFLGKKSNKTELAANSLNLAGFKDVDVVHTWDDVCLKLLNPYDLVILTNTEQESAIEILRKMRLMNGNFRTKILLLGKESEAEEANELKSEFLNMRAPDDLHIKMLEIEASFPGQIK